MNLNNIISNSNMQNYIIPYANYLHMFNWDLYVTLTPPYTLSLNSAVKAVQRLERNLAGKYENYRMFWVAEAFESCSYHVHLIIAFNDKSKTISKHRDSLQLCWDKAVAAKKRTVSKSVKYKRNENAIIYILKNFRKGKIEYGFSGNTW